LLVAFQREVTTHKRLTTKAHQYERDLACKREALRSGAAKMLSTVPGWVGSDGQPTAARPAGEPPRQWLETFEDTMAQAWDLHALLTGAAGPGGGMGGGGGGVGGCGGAAGAEAGGGGGGAPLVDAAFGGELAALFPAEYGVTEDELRAAYARSRQRHQQQQHHHPLAGAGSGRMGSAGGGGGGGGTSGGGGGNAPSPRGSVPPSGGAAALPPPPVALGPRAGIGSGIGGPGTAGAAEPPSPRMLTAIRAALANGAPSEAAVREAWAGIRPGTIGQQIFRVLCHAGPQGLKTADIAQRGIQLGFPWEDSQAKRNSLGQSMRQAAAAVVAKLPRERYALRFFPGVKEEEVTRLRGPGAGLAAGGGGGGGAGSGGGGGGGGFAGGAAAGGVHHHYPQQQQQHQYAQQQQHQQQQAYYQQQQQQQQFGGGGAAGGDDDNDDGFFA
jgi:DNA polymerase-3 subunit gamma/tau